MRNVAILLFDAAEELDFVGPLEVFAAASELHAETPFEVYTVAEHSRAIRAHNGLRVLPEYSFSNCPSPDILIISGGYGARSAMHNAAVVEWVQARAQKAEQVLGICTGAFIMASAGLLDGLEVTTHHELLDHLEEIAPQATVCEHKRVVDGGKILTSGGISPGIDLSLHVVSKLLGEAHAERTARYIGYPWLVERLV